jgi:hypothetical protein
VSDAERVKQVIEAIPSSDEPQMVGLSAHFPEMVYHGGAQYTVNCDCGFHTETPENYYVAKARWADHASTFVELEEQA